MAKKAPKTENTENTENAAPAVEMFTLKSICEELGLNPATARRKLRTKLPKTEGASFRWEFDADGKAQVVEILTAKPEPKAQAEDDEEAGDE